MNCYLLSETISGEPIAGISGEIDIMSRIIRALEEHYDCTITEILEPDWGAVEYSGKAIDLVIKTTDIDYQPRVDIQKLIIY